MKRVACCIVAAGALLLVVAQAAAASTTRQRIVALAQRELGYREPGNFCTKFGPCELWCSLFLTWVWRQEGIPIPSLAFTGDVYNWARASTYVEGPRHTPRPGDAVLFGTGPATVATSVHTGIVEAVYPGYLVTIEGDVVHNVLRFVVPMRDPQRIGEPGPIYAYASPGARTRVAGAAARAAAVRTFPALSPAVIGRQAAMSGAAERPLARTIAALRAFQHMPYRMPNARINWTGVNRQGLVEVLVTSKMPLSYARHAWRRFLHRFDDAGHAYQVFFQAAPGAPVAGSPPSISGVPLEGQTLAESHGSWSSGPSAYAYQWEDCDSSGQSCSPIGGATSETYTLTASDVGHTIRVQESASNPDGVGQPATSQPTSVVVGLPAGLG